MNRQEVVSLYETISVLTEQMVTAAKNANWVQLAALETQCALHIETIKGSDKEPVQGEMRERKIRIIQKILADDREIRNITEPWMQRLSKQISST
ncbi:MAG: flagellar protein FliT, partial [Burkholderiaceae bacterium]|nr:flagellar protein FliT [Burkholderiaceae bacterium]